MCSDTQHNGADPVIEVRNLVARYGEQLVLNDVTFDVPRGEIFVILSTDPAGTTYLRALPAAQVPALVDVRHTARCMCYHHSVARQR